MSLLTGASVNSLYVHVPFCAHKCEYCAFYSEASHGAVIQRYVDALTREFELIASTGQPRTIFFGGGTPSLLTLRQWQQIFAAMTRCGLSSPDEWTIECNPATVSLDKAELWRRHGVNRVSMGVQSLDEALLDRLGRVHSRAMVFSSFDTLRRAGFNNINVDLMFAIPGQTLPIWESTLAEALTLQSEHLSCYEVIYEEDTPLYAQLQAGEFDADEDLACDMYESLIDRASQAGFAQYEIANFARVSRGLAEGGWPMLACHHNINYWRGGSYHALGPSAAGYVDGVRTKNWSNTQLYCARLEEGLRAVEITERLPDLQRAGEVAAFGLRMNAGWPFEPFRQTTGFDLRVDWAAEMKDLQLRGWGEVDEQGVRLTRQGLRFADGAAELFLR